MRPYLFSIVLFGVGTIGCQSTRPGYSFQPAPHLVTEAAIPARALAAAPAPTLVRVAPLIAQRRPRRFARQHRRGRVAAPLRQSQPAAANPARRAKPQAPTEVGLGTTVFGLLGLLAVPVGLIGLALGGGLVWGLVAGAGALAVLVAWLDPFGW